MNAGWIFAADNADFAEQSGSGAEHGKGHDFRLTHALKSRAAAMQVRVHPCSSAVKAVS